MCVLVSGIDPPGALRLPKKWKDYLSGEAESGMGYQTGDVVLRDGTVVHDVVFVGATFISEVRGRDGIPFDPGDITEIRLTHHRWRFRR